jgi:uncharacterized protein (TIGR00255 family)
MLLSMTGQGQGRKQFGSAEISAEVRAVNNRHLKIQTRASDGLGALEPRIESHVRTLLRRGSLQLNVQLAGGLQASQYALQEEVLVAYFEQCKHLAERVGVPATVTLSDLLALPGVVREPRNLSQSPVDEELAAAVLATVGEAIANLNCMRAAEGESMGLELAAQLEKLRAISSAIESRAPNVVEEYKEKLRARLTAVLPDGTVDMAEPDIRREVLVMADKADIREEIVRLRSHFDQFEKLLGSDESQGRKLDFLIQELFRETNTIGSKAGDAQIAQQVVDMKTIIEQMRELVQNVE